MRSLSPAALALGIAIAGLAGGCGGGDETVVGPPQPEGAAAEIRRVVGLANTTFAEGDYTRTCSLYSAAAKLEVARSANTDSCEEAQQLAAKQVRATTSDIQFDALTAYVPEDVVVDGDSAVASYGPLPGVLGDVPGLNGGRTLEMERIAGEWRIAGLPR